MNPSSSSSAAPKSGIIPRLKKGETIESLKTGKPVEHQKALSIPRVFTTVGSDPLEEVTYEKRTSRIANTNGSVVFRRV
jgi:hypothetical protein